MSGFPRPGGGSGGAVNQVTAANAAVTVSPTTGNVVVGLPTADVIFSTNAPAASVNFGGQKASNMAAGTVGSDGANLNNLAAVQSLIPSAGSTAANIGPSSGGVSGNYSRSDHVHATSEGAASLVSNTAIAAGGATLLTTPTLQPGIYHVWGQLTLDNTSGTARTVDANITNGTATVSSITGGASGSVTVAGVIGDTSDISTFARVVITVAGTLILQAIGNANITALATTPSAAAYPNATGIMWEQVG